MKQANLASKNVNANFVQKDRFWWLNKKFKYKSYKNIKTKHVLIENELNELSKKLETISTKVITVRLKE